MLLTSFDYVEQDLQKKFPPFVAQHQTVDHNVIGHNATGKLDLLWHPEKISYPLLRVEYLRFS